MPAEGDAVEAEALDKGRFAGAGRTGNADPDGAAGVREERLDKPLGIVAMVRAGRFYERDGAGESPPIAPPDGCDQLLGGHALISPPRVGLRAAPLPVGGSTSRHRCHGAAAI